MTQRPARLDAIVARAGIAGPAAVLDLDAFDADADLLARRAGGVPIRVATKSLRCRALVDRALARPGFAGLLAFRLDEALWLVGSGGEDDRGDRADRADRGDRSVEDGRLAADDVPAPSAAADVLVAYPTLDPRALAALAADPVARGRVALVVDDPVHVAAASDAVAAAGLAAAPPVRLWPDLDASLRLGGLHGGARRSPLREADDVLALVEAIAAAPGVELGGLMMYDAQIAGQADRTPILRVFKACSGVELARRRARIVRAVARVADVPAVNSGGSGSLHVMAPDPYVTELAAGSGLLGTHLFDGYRGWAPHPALYVVCDVVRTPAPGWATVFAGGYPASGAAGRDRLPTPVYPPGLVLSRAEGAGEVQTPLRARRGARAPRPGERVWFRPAKAGETLERFDVLHLVAGDRLVGTVPTYRGEGRAFG